MTVLNALPITLYTGDGAGLPAMEIIHRFGRLYGAIHPPSRTRPIGAGPMFELKHQSECTYAPGCEARLAHLLQTLPFDMIATPGRRLPIGEILASLLREGLDVNLRLKGWSMKPLVPSGSLVRFSPIGVAEGPSLGDVVLARLPNDALVAHRVVAMDSEWIWMKGDACRNGDGPVPRASVIARAVRREGFISLPLSNAFMRIAGLVVNRLYPRLVAAVHGVCPS